MGRCAVVLAATLAIVKRSVEKMNGMFGVDSSLEKVAA
jgi:hypothetical protein